jgi:hypothetical protein
MATGGTANGGTANGGTANGGTANGGAGNGAAACMHASWTIAATDECMDSNPSCPNIPVTQKALANAIDGDATTRYTSGKTQAGNESVTVTFPSTVTISGVGLTSMNGDGPVMYDVQYSPDGTTFMEFTPAVTGAGSDLLTITFPAPQAMKAVRVKQTGMVMAPATSWWSIYEFTVTGCM